MSERRNCLVKPVLAIGTGVVVLALLPSGVRSYDWPGQSWGRAAEGDREACYYVTKGARKRWGPQIHEAAFRWSMAGARFRFVYRSNIDECEPENYVNKTSQKNYRLFRYNPKCWSYEGHPLCPGLAVVEWRTDNNRILRARTFLNNIDVPDLEPLSVSLHEFGHWLLLDDIDDPNAIMYRHFTGRTTLGQDDINGIIAIYGARSGTPMPTPNM